jgi:hypothetical protein
VVLKTVIRTIKRLRKKFGGTKNGYKDHQAREKEVWWH